jgi:hypothetical protein
MKIGWATPLHYASAAGRFSVGVAEALARCGVQVDLLRTERLAALEGGRLPSALAVRDIARMRDLSALQDWDLMVCTIGDNSALHHFAVDALHCRPGICIFHDRTIANLFPEWMTARGEAHRIAGMIDRLYGPPDPQPAAHRTMIEWLAPYALAAVVHERDDLPTLAECCAGPVRHIPPPHDPALADGPSETRGGSHASPGWRDEAASFDAYATAFLPLAHQALEVEPLIRLGRQLGQELSDLGARPDGPEALRIAQLAANLFHPGGKSCPQT